MIKFVSSFVFKFVGGDGVDRGCYYCHKITGEPHVAVYANCACETDEICLFICRSCIGKGLRESAEGWERLLSNAKKDDTPK